MEPSNINAGQILRDSWRISLLSILLAVTVPAGISKQDLESYSSNRILFRFVELPALLAAILETFLSAV